MSQKIITPDHKRNIITRGLPKTDQETQFRAGDDGQYEAGWWVRRLVANNRTRFITKLISGAWMGKDRATNLWWPLDWSGAAGKNGNYVTWNSAIDYANSLNFAGKTDWRLPNVRELASIIDYSKSAHCFYNIFSNVDDTDYYWTSTTRTEVTNWAWAINAHDGLTRYWNKTDVCFMICVRGGL